MELFHYTLTKVPSFFTQEELKTLLEENYCCLESLEWQSLADERVIYEYDCAPYNAEDFSLLVKFTGAEGNYAHFVSHLIKTRRDHVTYLNKCYTTTLTIMEGVNP